MSKNSNSSSSLIVLCEEKQDGIMLKHFKDKMECVLNLVLISDIKWSKKKIASDLQ